MSKKNPCPHCGASMSTNSYTMNLTLLRALAKIATKPPGTSIKEVGLSKPGYANYTKLKYWGFIDRIEDGSWLVTEAGREFLEGKTSTFKEIEYFRDKVVSTDGLVWASDILPSEESKQKYRDLMRPFLSGLEI